MGGIGLSCNQPQPNTSHTYAHRTQIQDTHIRNNTPANIYICTDKTKHIYTCTQYAHTQNRIQYAQIQQHNNMQHIHTTQNYEHR